LLALIIFLLWKPAEKLIIIYFWLVHSFYYYLEFLSNLLNAVAIYYAHSNTVSIWVRDSFEFIENV